MLANFPELSTLGLFAVVSFFVAASPGPTWIYVLSCAMSYGRSAAWFSVFGNLFGIGLHVVVSSVGLSLLLSSSEIFLFVLSKLGGLYLIYLGISRLRGGASLSLQNETSEYGAYSKREVMIKTALINILNPKVLLLFLTLLPQFADQNKSFLHQSLVFGFLHACIASLILFSVIEIFFAASSRAIASNLTTWTWFNRIGAVVICAFGVNLLMGSWL